jgi:hypothetical protein
MEMRREIGVHERPDDPARERRQQMPVVDENDATFACNNNNNNTNKHDDCGGGEGAAARHLPLNECFSMAMSWSSPLREGTPEGPRPSFAA